MSKSLYSFFNCDNKEELHQKLLNDDPITQPLKELFNDLAKEKVYEYGQIGSQAMAVNFFIRFLFTSSILISVLLSCVLRRLLKFFSASTKRTR